MKITPVNNEKLFLIISGFAFGLVIVILSAAGNPPNMAFCTACFLRDITGALGAIRPPAAQYMRPEIPALVLGAFAVSIYKKEFASKGGSSPFSRFTLGACLMVGALLFMGCPMRMLLRLAGGDLNAAVGLIGFVGGVGLGALFLQKGFTLNRAYDLPKVEGRLFPAACVLLAVLVLSPITIFYASEAGPGAMAAPVAVSLAGGAVIGAIGARTRLCFVNDIRDFLLFRQAGTASVFTIIFVTVLIGNMVMNKFNIGFVGQPFAHTDAVWNVAGMFLAGFAATLLGGCPFRQLVMAGSGNADAAVTVLGLMAGAALAHNFGMAATADGATMNGKAGFAACMIVTLAIAFMNVKRTDGNARITDSSLRSE